jgi:hypothetical protein
MLKPISAFVPKKTNRNRQANHQTGRWSAIQFVYVAEAVASDIPNHRD